MGVRYFTQFHRNPHDEQRIEHKNIILDFIEKIHMNHILDRIYKIRRSKQF